MGLQCGSGVDTVSCLLLYAAGDTTASLCAESVPYIRAPMIKGRGNHAIVSQSVPLERRKKKEELKTENSKLAESGVRTSVARRYVTV